MNAIYKKIKKQNGERFARTLRDYHNGLLEIEGIDEIVKHAGRDAAPLLPYLMSLLAANDDVAEPQEPGCPFKLLEEAGYDAFHADTLDKQNSIMPYFNKNERLCTFNDMSRHQNYYIVHAVKKNVDSIVRSAFNGKEERQDEYGTSVISIQIAKDGGFISIKNRYNHTVEGCDNTFNSNPDQIIGGLAKALKTHFGVDFDERASALPESGYVVMGGKILKCYTEQDNIYYGDQAWAKDGEVHEVKKAQNDALFDGYYFDMKTKTLRNINEESDDSFPEDFNRTYGGRKGLSVHEGNLVLDGEVIIEAEKSRIKRMYLPGLTKLSYGSLESLSALIEFSAPDLVEAVGMCLADAVKLSTFNAPELRILGSYGLERAYALISLNVPKLEVMGDHCLRCSGHLRRFDAPLLIKIGDRGFEYAKGVIAFNTPKLESMGVFCLYDARDIKVFNAPLVKMPPPYIKERVRPKPTSHGFGRSGFGRF